VKILIIKNDGFGDLTMVIHMLNNIKFSYKSKIQIILSKGSEPLGEYLKHFDKFFLSRTGPQLKDNYKVFISEGDKEIIQNIKKKNFDIAISLRRYLNFEHVILMNAINSKEKYSCYQFINSKNLSLYLKKFPLNDWNNISIPKDKVNDLDYYEYFLKKINLLDSGYKFNSFIKKLNFKKKGLILNLSGEKSFYKKDNFKFLINNISYLFKDKITIIGKTFQQTTDKKIKSILKNINNQNIINLYDKVDFKKSIDLIKKNKIYIGFDTGLSHFAVNTKIKSLIILGSGPGFKWFPYPANKRFNETYWLYNTPCAGCNNSSVKEGCFFEKRICVDNIFSNKLNINIHLKKFFSSPYQKITNFSNYNDFIPDWTMPSSKLKLHTITNDAKLIKIENILHFKYIVFFYKYVYFLVKNNLVIYLLSNIIFRFLNRFLRLVKN
jgi:ADP-heptose:LPS heptosyltransferase